MVCHQIFFVLEGLRHSCTLSPLLFLLAVDSLSRPIEKAKSEGKFHGNFKVSVGSLISNLMFVDDIFILGSVTLEEWRYMKSMVDMFNKASGLDINLTKSCFIYTKM